MQKRIFLMMMSALLLLIAVLGALRLFPEPRVNWTPPEQGAYAKTITVAADIDYQPFSFLNENGRPAGYDAELAYALGAQMECNVNLRLMTWVKALDGLKNGECDLLMGVTYSPSRLETMTFSSPVNADPYIAFGTGNSNFSLTELPGKKLRTIAGDSVNEAFIIPYGLEDSTVYDETYSQCFSSLAAGKCDYVIAPYTIGRHLAEAMKLDGVRPVGPELYNSIYCIAVRAGNEELLWQINRALTDLSGTGKLDEIYNRWLVRYASSVSLHTFLKENRDYLMIAVLSIVLVFFVALYLVERSSYQKLFLAAERSRIFEETLTEPLMEYDPAADLLNYIDRDGEGQIRRTRCRHYFSRHLHEKKIAPEFRTAYEKILREGTLPGGGNVLEYRAQVASGQWGWYRAVVHTVRGGSGKTIRVLARLENITRDVEKQNAALQLASTDRLTGLLNREAFLSAASERLASGRVGNFALAMLDIDNFKQINDRFGHAEGDQALQQVAERMQRAFRPEDLLGRFGGDEFLMFMQCEELDVVKRRIGQCCALLSDPEGGRALTCNCGVVFSGDTSVPVDRLLRMADQAMYQAKQNGKNRCTYLLTDSGDAAPAEKSPGERKNADTSETPPENQPL